MAGVGQQTTSERKIIIYQQPGRAETMLVGMEQEQELAPEDHFVIVIPVLERVAPPMYK